MLQHEKLKTLQQITGLVINFFQNNQNFDSGEKSTSKHTDLTSNQTETRILCFIIKCVKTVKFNVIYLTKSLSRVILHCESSLVLSIGYVEMLFKFVGQIVQYLQI